MSTSNQSHKAIVKGRRIGETPSKRYDMLLAAYEHAIEDAEIRSVIEANGDGDQ